MRTLLGTLAIAIIFIAGCAIASAINYVADRWSFILGPLAIFTGLFFALRWALKK